MLNPADGRPRLSSLSRFTPPLEQEFEESYFERVIPTVRLVAPIMVALLLVGLRLSVRTPAPSDLMVALPQIAFWAIAFALSWIPHFWRVWQPLLVLLGLLTAVLVLSQLAPMLAGQAMGTIPLVVGHTSTALPPTELPSISQQRFFYTLQFVLVLIPLAVLRLRFVWASLLYVGVVIIGMGAFTKSFPPAPDLFVELHFTFLPIILVLFPLLLMAFIQERLSRIAFWASHQLEIERNDERRKFQETESKLHVLAQAIGGIVHDLGNPLAAVQMGSETMEIFLEDETPNKALLSDVAHSIHEGAQMLNFLRLSLIEQTRVLEGKPTPVSPKPVALRSILQRSVRFQKPHVIGKRVVQLSDGDALLCADEMKMVTVWMNLIGNALKYSDGNIQVRWNEFPSATGHDLLVAVTDKGFNGHGISRANAAKLFSAFGRLEAHSQIEGTGLGLLSVQKIIEAHGGQVWIEGFEDGTPTSPRFSTGVGATPSLLQDDDRTAFVVRCPLAEHAQPSNSP